jgi:hypothetical protein
MELKYKEIVVTDISMNKSFIRKTVKLQLEKKGIPTKAGILAMLNVDTLDKFILPSKSLTLFRVNISHPTSPNS